MSVTTSVAARAALSVGLMIGFYLLAVTIAGVLLYLPYAELVYAHRLHLKLALLCLVGAATILWSILPRLDRFAPPGPQLERDSNSTLFAEIEGVASATGQEMPKEVFLVGDVNAWVAQRGGVMGLFSRRVMGLGLPLLQALSVSELRAVLAHEFGHYYGGDTKLGPWVYKTRSAIGRTIAGLGDSWLNKPFQWYGQMFLRVTNAVSRRQELSADALASRVVGSRPLVEGLKKVQAAAPAYDAYWSQEVRPILSMGFLPPIADGFRRFAAHDRIAKAMAGMVEQGLREGRSDPFDTHPPLPERIAAVASLPPGPLPASDPPAISLLEDVAALEREWLVSLSDETRVGALRPVAWESVVQQAWLPAWREAVSKNAAVLGEATVADLGEVVQEASARAAMLSVAASGESTAEARAAFVRWLAGAATVLVFDRAGWTIEAPPGAAITARRNGAEASPFEVVQKLCDGKLSPEAWRSEADQLGVGPLRLGG